MASNDAITQFLGSAQAGPLPEGVVGGASQAAIDQFLGPAPDVSLAGPPGVSFLDRPGSGGFKGRFERKFNAEFLEDELLPKGLRVDLAHAPTVKDRIEMLQSRFGEVKQFEGRLFVPDPDPVTGAPRFMEARVGMLGGLVGAAPEMAFTMLGTAGGAPMAATRLGKLLNLSLRGAAGAAAGGAAEDVVWRELHGLPAQVPEIAKRRAAQGVLDFFLNVAGGGAEELVTSLAGLKGLRERTRASFEGEEFQGLLERGRDAAERLGVPLTPAERSGSPTLARVESLVSNIPLARERFRKLRIRERNTLFKAIERDVGPMGDLLSDEQLGRMIVDALNDPGRLTREALVQERAELGRVSFREFTRALDEIEPRFRGIYARSAGTRFKAAARVKKIDRFDNVNEAQYGAFKREFTALMEQQKGVLGPEADRIVDIAPLQAYVRKIAEQRAPKRAQQIEPGERLIQLTDPPDDAEALDGIVERLVPSPLRDTPLRGIMDYLEDLTPRQTLDEARELRRDISDAIVKSMAGESHTRINPHDLIELAKLASKQIDNAVDNVPDPAVAELLRVANDFYSKNIGQYEKRGIAELIAQDRHGHDVMEDGAVVARLFQNAQGTGRGNSDYYFSLKEFFGSNSEEFGVVKRVFLDDLVTRAGAGGDTLDGVVLGKLLSQGQYNREILEDLFPGKHHKRLLQIVDRLKQGDNLGNISRDDFIALARDPSPSAKQVRELLKAQRTRDQELTNRFFKQAEKLSGADLDTMPVSNLVPLLRRADPGEARGLFNRLQEEGRGDLIDKLRRKFMYSVFLEADTFRSVSDAGKDFAGAASVWRVVRDEKSRARLTAILTPAMEANFYDYLGVMALKAQRDRIAATTGALLQGSMLHKMATSLQGIKDVVIYDALSWLMTNEGIAKFIASPRNPVVADTLLRLSMLSGPMAQEMFDTDDQHVLSTLRARVQDGLNEFGLAELMEIMGEVEEQENSEAENQ